MNIKPIGARVLVKVLQEEEITKSGIVLPDTAKEKPSKGEIIAVGTGKVTDNGVRIEPEVKVGDKVLFSKFAGTEFKEDGVDYLIMWEKDILGVM